MTEIRPYMEEQLQLPPCRVLVANGQIAAEPAAAVAAAELLAAKHLELAEPVIGPQLPPGDPFRRELAQKGKNGAKASQRQRGWTIKPKAPHCTCGAKVYLRGMCCSCYKAKQYRERKVGAAMPGRGWRKRTDVTIEGIQELRAYGMTMEQVAQRLGCHVGLVFKRIREHRSEII